MANSPFIDYQHEVLSRVLFELSLYFEEPEQALAKAVEEAAKREHLQTVGGSPTLNRDLENMNNLVLGFYQETKRENGF